MRRWVASAQDVTIANGLFKMSSRLLITCFISRHAGMDSRSRCKSAISVSFRFQCPSAGYGDSAGLHPWNETQIISVTGRLPYCFTLSCFARTRFRTQGAIGIRAPGAARPCCRPCDEAIDATAGVAGVGEGFTFDLFGLERFHEAFGLGVVEGIAGPRISSFVRLIV
jgi:hypothetical protein